MAVNTLDTNLLASARKPKQAEDALRPPPPSLGKRILKSLAYAAIFFSALIFFFLLKTPGSLVEGLVLNTLNQNGMRAQADKVSTHFFLLPHLRAERLTLEPPGAPPLTFDLLRIYPSPLSLLRLSPGISFEGEAYGAKLSGSAASNMALSLSILGADLAKLTPLAELGGAVKGVVSTLSTDLSVPGGRISRASGKIEAKGTGFVLDPGGFQIPMALPVMDLGILDLQASLDRGKLRIEKLNLGTAGKDLELRLTGEIQLQDNLPMSRGDLRLRIKPSEKILQAMPAIKTMLGTIAAQQPDGFYAMKMAGTLTNMGLPQPDR
jgi:type II secretion system protein N